MRFIEHYMFEVKGLNMLRTNICFRIRGRLSLHITPKTLPLIIQRSWVYNIVTIKMIHINYL